MAYGKGSKSDSLKRMADLGFIPLSEDMAVLHSKCLSVVTRMADAVWQDNPGVTLPDGKTLDATMLRVQSQASKEGMNNVWAEKMRLLAKSASVEQWRRRQKSLFGRFKNISARSDKPMSCGKFPLMNLPHVWSDTLSEADVTQLQELADRLDFREVLTLFEHLEGKSAEYGLTDLQREALQVLSDRVSGRFGCPIWKEDARFQLHLDYRCLKGTKKTLDKTLTGLNNALQGGSCDPVCFEISSHKPYGTGIPIRARFAKAVMDRLTREESRSRQSVKSLVIEMGKDKVQVKAVVLRYPKTAEITGSRVVVAEDFGLLNTSSLVVARSATGISQDRIDFARSKLGKRETKTYLESHMSGDDVEILERIQISGRGFLDRLKAQAGKIDTLRSEIDRIYNRLTRIKHEINRVLGKDPGTYIGQDPENLLLSNTEQDRYIRMRDRFFRLLKAVDKLKARRRSIYRSIDGVKRSWFGYVSSIKAGLAEKHKAVVVSEDLSILAVEKSDPKYKGRTFNKLLNNGSKGQYTRRSNDKLDWRGLARITVPSFYTSTTDWRDGTVDKKQRTGSKFKTKDGHTSDADLHAAEFIARWLFLKPKPVKP